MYHKLLLLEEVHEDEASSCEEDVSSVMVAVEEEDVDEEDDAMLDCFFSNKTSSDLAMTTSLSCSGEFFLSIVFRSFSTLDIALKDVGRLSCIIVCCVKVNTMPMEEAVVGSGRNVFQKIRGEADRKI